MPLYNLSIIIGEETFKGIRQNTHTQAGNSGNRAFNRGERNGWNFGNNYRPQYHIREKLDI